jgi:hypothetical protein
LYHFHHKNLELFKDHLAWSNHVNPSPIHLILMLCKILRPFVSIISISFHLWVNSQNKEPRVHP